MLLSLAVASFTRSQVIAMAWIDAATEGRVSSLRSGGDNLECMPARSGCPKGMKGGGSMLYESFMVATSSGMGRASGYDFRLGVVTLRLQPYDRYRGYGSFESGSGGFSLSGCVAVR